ncbi:MAG: hypothetical protein DVB31_00465 [Verrucomicrobia bacterium]|nr:MAG: hypothetical protein DVB31_00465 [Verrucomicrobiota bacterium]
MKLLLPWLSAFLLLVRVAAESPQAVAPAEKTADISRFTNSLVLGPPDGAGTIAQIAARSLERYHFSKMKFRDEISARLFDRYIEALDPQKMYFFQSDYDEFSAKYRTHLDELTMNEKDVQPAYDIFNRFLQRFDLQYVLVNSMLGHERFAFDGNDRVSINRKDEPRPRDLADARRLWRDRLRYEILSEKLNQTDIPVLATNAWRKIVFGIDAATIAKLPRGRRGSLDRATVSDLESIVGKADAHAIDEKISGGKWTKFGDLVGFLSEKKAGTNAAEVNAIASGIWRRAVGFGEAAAAGHLPEGFKGPLATNVVAELEAIVGKEHAKVVVSMVETGKWTSRANLAAYLAEKLPAEREKETVEKLTRRYNRTLRTLKQYEPDEVLQIYLDALAHSYDPHSDYFGKSELDSFSIQMGLTLFGIGATLQSEDGYTVIRNVVPGSPAAKSRQIEVGDKIVAVAQGDDGEWVDIVDEKLKKVVDQIRGPKGTRVRLTVVPAGGDSSARKLVSIVRDEVKLEDSEAKARLVELPGPDGRVRRVGVIDLPSFYASFPVGSAGRSSVKKSTTADVSRLVRKLTAEKAEGIVLDLRRNGGGSLEEAINLTGLFIKTGPVVQVKESSGRVMQDEDRDPSVLYDGPLMVLTSRFSASASEIVAGALQDYGRAIIVGDTSTHGKGTVQTIQELGMFLPDTGINPGAVKLTIRKFYRASGESTQLKGVVPDVVLPSVNNLLEVGESSLTNALPWDTIPPAEYEKLNRIQPHLAQLMGRSSNRIASDRDWAYVREDMDLYGKRQAEKSIALNLSQRLRERDADKARAEARKKELAARGEKDPKTYEITLKIVDKPGLPSPLTRSNVVATSRGDLRLLAKDAAAKADAEAAPTRPHASSDDDDEPDAEPSTALDVHLREAERILLDLIELSGGKKGVVATPGV